MAPVALQPTTSSPNMTASEESSSPAADDYDSTGAMQYIVATVSVYALVGIFSLMLVRIIRRAKRRRLYLHEENQHVRRYLRNGHAIRLEGVRQLLMLEKMRTSLILWERRRAPATFERSVSRPAGDNVSTQQLERQSTVNDESLEPLNSLSTEDEERIPFSIEEEEEERGIPISTDKKEGISASTGVKEPTSVTCTTEQTESHVPGRAERISVSIECQGGISAVSTQKEERIPVSTGSRDSCPRSTAKSIEPHSHRDGTEIVQPCSSTCSIKNNTGVRYGFGNIEPCSINTENYSEPQSFSVSTD